MEFDSPRWKAGHESDESDEPAKHALNNAATYAVSAQYAAYADRSGVFCRRLASNEDYKRLFRYEDDRPWFQPILAFSTIAGSLLAIATGLQILIFDAETKKVKYALKGNGRIVTSVAWAASKPGILATGAVDGSLCIWSLRHPSRPVHHMRAFHGACNHVAFHPRDSDLVAGCHRNCISVWSLPTARPFLVTKSRDSDIKALNWFSSDPTRIIGISASGAVSIYDVQQALRSFRLVTSSGVNYEQSYENTVFGRLEDIGYMPSSDFDLGFGVSQALLVGRNGLIVLPQQGHILFFLTFSAEHNTATELWRLRLDALIDCFSPQVRERAIYSVACFGADTEAYEVPTPVLDAMGWEPTAEPSRNPPPQDAVAPTATMKPELSLYRRLPRSRQRQPYIQAPLPDAQSAPAKRKKGDTPVKRHDKSPTSVPQSMTSSLELPKPKEEDDEHDSPMPFLSPSVHAKTTGFTSIAQLDDTLRLPPPQASFDSITSTAGHDSDSDDESFTDQLQGSGSYLPGGVNIPLPGTCGATFGPNGQLLTFFTARPKAPSVADLDDTQAGRVRQNSEITKLFPGFGNLGLVSRSNAIASSSDGSSSPENVPYFEGRFASQPPLDSHLHSLVRFSPTKANSMVFAGEQMVNVSVREIESLSSYKLLSDRYRLLCEQDENIAGLCHGNADHANEVGLDEAANLWRLLALVVEERGFDGYDAAVRDGFTLPLSSQSQRPPLSRNLSMASSFAEQSRYESATQLRWLQHPFGKDWAVGRLIEWAEDQHDLQLLALVSALLTCASASTERQGKDQRMRIGIPTDSFNHSSPATDFRSMRGPTQDIPLLRAGTNLSEMSSFYDSLVKPDSSRTSSREASMPTTPYLDSASSTPPFTFTSLNRQTTRLSVSGSASPETQRSSLGAAAKFYAQSISDKLAAFGTSPPNKKISGSPNNELSSSLPSNAVGSWSKSVSFASGTDISPHHIRGLSLAQEDDNYDSDRTIDDTSLPQTPRPNSSGVLFRTLNGGQNFFGEAITNFSSPSTSSSLIPEDLLIKSQVIRDTYSEQLRAWNLLMQAAELDNIPSSAYRPTNPWPHTQTEGILPYVPRSSRNATCSVCFCIIQAAEQLCPSCLHASHPDCLAEVMKNLDENAEAFTCPSGCGCNCVEVTAGDYEIDEQEDQGERDGGDNWGQGVDEALRPPFTKKGSLTDPRVLKARLQGESW